MGDFRWMIFMPILLLATAAHAQTDARKLDQMAQKLVKQCEAQGGTFALESASASHGAITYSYGEGRIEERKWAQSHPNGGTAYQAGGTCTNKITIDFAH